MTYDFFVGQLRLALVGFLAYAGGKGWLTPSDAGAVTAILSPLAAIALPVLWSWSANWRKKYVPADSIAIASDTHTLPRIIGGQISGVGGTVVGAFALLFMMSCHPLYAADVLASTVASAASIGSACTPTSCSGAYAGLQIGGNGSNADIIGNGIDGSVFAGGILPSVDFGYLYKNGAWLYGAEVGLGYNLVSNASVNGVGNSENGFFAYQVVKVGGDLGALFGTSSPITVPPELASSLISLYGQIGTAELKLPGTWASGLASGAGGFFDVGPHTFINIDYMSVVLNSKIPGLNVGNLNIIKAGINYKF
jgi:hypothetical protein